MQSSGMGTSFSTKSQRYVVVPSNGPVLSRSEDGLAILDGAPLSFRKSSLYAEMPSNGSGSRGTRDGPNLPAGTTAMGTNAALWVVEPSKGALLGSNAFAGLTRA